MNLSEESMMELMAYADGEEVDRAKIEKLLSESEEAVRFVEQIGGLGDFVKMTHATRDAKTIATFDVADAVMKSLPAAETKKVASLDAARAKKSRAGMGVAAVVTALALAASVFFFARPKETPLSQAPVAMQQQPKPVDTKSGDVGVEIEKAGSSVSVFYLPSENEVSTSVVVWVDESAEK